MPRGKPDQYVFEDQHDKAQTAKMVNISDRRATRARPQPPCRSQSDSTFSSLRTASGGVAHQKRRLQAQSPVVTGALPIFAHWAEVYRHRGY